MLSKPKWPDRAWFFRVVLYKDGGQEPCPACDVVGVRVMEFWTERDDPQRPGFCLTRHTMMPCHCIVVSSKGLGGCGPREDIPYPPDDPDEADYA